MYWQITALVVAVIALAAVLWLLMRSKSADSSRKTSQEAAKFGYSVWRSFGKTWKMCDNFSAKDCIAGPAPTKKARFEGECVRVISVPQRPGP